MFHLQISDIENKLLETQHRETAIVPQATYRDVYIAYKNKYPNTLLNLSAISYTYALKSLSSSERDFFIQAMKEEYGEAAYNYNQNFALLKLTLGLSSKQPPRGFNCTVCSYLLFDEKQNPLGSISVIQKLNEFEMDIFLNSSSQGKNIGTKAVRELVTLYDDPRMECEKIMLVVGSDNEKAALVYARAGFEPSAKLLKEITIKLKCNEDEAHAKFLFNSSSDELANNDVLCQIRMERIRNAPFNDLSAKSTYEELLAAVRKSHQHDYKPV